MCSPEAPLLATLVLLAATATSCAASSSDPGAYTSAEQPFLTNRTPRDDGRYGTEAGMVTAGRCRLRVGNSEDERIHVEGIDPLPTDALLATFDEPEDAPITFYLHGYNIDLERACREAARLARGTGQEGRVLLFSWPASSAIVTYGRDAERFEDSRAAILEALEGLSRDHGRERVNIVAHSMGARIVEALASAPEAGSRPFANLVLIAPDIERERFLDLLPALASVVEDITVFVSDSDRLLLLSQSVHLAERLGQSDGVDIEGVEVIDVTELEDAGFGGHLYHLTNRSVGRALEAILEGRPDARLPEAAPSRPPP
jgi:esterase/lipase superfamily enzyme